MILSVLVQKVCFRFRIQYRAGSSLRKWYWQAQGAQIGTGTRVPPLYIIWPHQLFLGENCVLEHGISFKYAGFWKPGPSIVLRDRVFVGNGCEFNIRQHLQIGSDCLIGSGCKFIDHDHGIALDSGPMNSQAGSEAAIVVEEDVWLGVNVVVLKGVTIGTGAIVGAGAIVTKSIPPNEIWAGVPARKIGERC